MAFGEVAGVSGIGLKMRVYIGMEGYIGVCRAFIGIMETTIMRFRV